MKVKRFAKKLVLNKHTVANLDPRQMGNIAGGGITYTTACNTCVETCMTQCPACTMSCNLDCITPPCLTDSC